ncbi:MAG: hypothetical protein ABUT20_16985 [Bacteroidota bacterium]
MKSELIKPGKEKYLLLNKLGAELKLSFSSHLVLARKIIAFDGINRKLLVVNTGNGLNDFSVIDLAAVKSITVNKQYSPIKAGELLKRKFEEFLESITLMFDFEKNVDNKQLHFYRRGIDSYPDLPALERNARIWQMILSKIAGSENHKMPGINSNVLAKA